METQLGKVWNIKVEDLEINSVGKWMISLYVLIKTT